LAAQVTAHHGGRNVRALLLVKPHKVSGDDLDAADYSLPCVGALSCDFHLQFPIPRRVGKAWDELQITSKKSGITPVLKASRYAALRAIADINCRH
jgi:hypothetical protein